MNYIWGASIVETCLRMMIDLWKMRKEEVYGKEEVTKQQKRKEKSSCQCTRATQSPRDSPPEQCNAIL